MIPALLWSSACEVSTGTEVGAPASMNVVAGADQEGAAGAALPTQPQVEVVDASGNGVAGVPVAFSVTAGGGSVEQTSAVTDVDGLASSGAWTLGPTAGAQSLSASVVALGSATIAATAVAGPAATLEKSAGDAQTAVAGTAVADAPAVEALDAYGNAVADVEVTFAVASGGGSVTAGTATSDASGVATAGGWILGSTVGEQTITASAPGVDAVTFTATATDPCDARAAITTASTVEGELTDADCVQNALHRDFYSFEVSQTTSLAVSLQAPSFRSWHAILRADGTVVGGVSAEAVDEDLRAYYLLPAGSYTLRVSGVNETDLGSYTLATAVESPQGCNSSVDPAVVYAFVAAPVTVSGSIGSTDCLSPLTEEHRLDSYTVLLQGGTSYTVQIDAAISIAIEAWRLGSMEEYQRSSSGEATFTITPSETAYYEIEVIGNEVGVEGSYSIQFTIETDPCTQRAALQLDGWVGGNLTANDCRTLSRNTDYLSLDLAGQTAVEIGMGPGSVSYSVAVFRGEEFVLGWVLDDAGVGESFRMILPAGQYDLRVRPADEGAAGTYDVTATTVDEDNSDPSCSIDALTITDGVSTSQAISESDCVSPITGENYVDQYNVLLLGGETYSFTVSAAMAVNVELWDATSVVASGQDAAGNVAFTFTPTDTAYFLLAVVGDEPNSTGSYTLSVQRQ